MHDTDAIWREAEQEIIAAKDLQSLDTCRVHYLGKKGLLTEFLKNLGQLPVEERPAAGQKVNVVKAAIQELILKRTSELQAVRIEEALAAETIDVTLAGRTAGTGSIHPITQTCIEIRRIFTRMGFVCLDGPEIEEDYYNFTALNVPPLHPARAMQDTFYFDDGTLLRSQMSPVQIHALEKCELPLRMIALGRVYRRDFDLTHTPMFHQLECLVVDEHITFAMLKGLLNDFLREFFQTEIVMRLRPSYFPFTEPSAEVDMGCINCARKGCRICKNTGWLEILGCGMVHPEVLRQAKVDSEKYRGFAFGLGIDRLTLLRYGMTDLRALFENDLRFLRQF